MGYPHVQCHQAQHRLWPQNLETAGILPFGTLYRAMFTMSNTQSHTTMPTGQMRERAQKDEVFASELQSQCSRDSSSAPILEPTLRTVTLNTPGVNVSSLCPKSYGFLLAHLSNSTRLEEQQAGSCWDTAGGSQKLVMNHVSSSFSLLGTIDVCCFLLSGAFGKEGSC